MALMERVTRRGEFLDLGADGPNGISHLVAVRAYEQKLRAQLREAVMKRAADFNDYLHYFAALGVIIEKYPYADVDIAVSVVDQLVKEGVVWF